MPKSIGYCHGCGEWVYEPDLYNYNCTSYRTKKAVSLLAHNICDDERNICIQDNKYRDEIKRKANNIAKQRYKLLRCI